MDYQPTPIQEIAHPAVKAAGIRLLVKREDLNHPAVSGNKWWKLKYNLLEAQKTGATLLTFGGAYSNHIYATAAACAQCNIGSIGIIRGEAVLPLNPTLRFAADHGMRLHYLNRSAYREKHTAHFIRELHEKFGSFYLVPEGGSNLLAVRGCAEFAAQEFRDIGFDHAVLAVGTGGTMAGIICGLKEDKNVIGVSVLKNGAFLSEDISRMASGFGRAASGKFKISRKLPRWSLLTDYHYGGYAKDTPALLDFIHEMGTGWNLPLDRVYTAKALHALMCEVKGGAFRRGDTVLFLHTGGLQAGGMR